MDCTVYTVICMSSPWNSLSSALSHVNLSSLIPRPLPSIYRLQYEPGNEAKINLHVDGIMYMYTYMYMYMLLWPS